MTVNQINATSENNRSLVLKQPKCFTVEDREPPAPCSSREVLVRIVATGLCGSDLHFWQHGRIGACVADKPIVLGHESAGIVEAIGPDVKDVAVGDRVALEPGASCNTCPACRKGRYNLCSSMRFAATPPYDGSLSTFYQLPEECCFPLPAEISLEEGALVEPLSVAVHCCKLAGIVPCSSLVIFGAGPIGLLCAAVAKAFGATRILVVDAVQSRLTFAEEYLSVLKYHIDTKVESGWSCERALLTLGEPSGANVVIDATGAAQCIDYGLEILERGGTFIQAGLGSSRIPFPIGVVCDKEAVFKGSFRYGPGDYKLAIDLLKSSKVSVLPLITHRYAFGDAEKAFIEVSKKVGIKSIIYGPGYLPGDRTNGYAGV